MQTLTLTHNPLQNPNPPPLATPQTEWEFKDDESFKNARQRLAKGFSYCPDKGNRSRKRAPKDEPKS